MNGTRAAKCLLWFLVACSSLASGQQPVAVVASEVSQPVAEQPTANFPHYLQSPIVVERQAEHVQAPHDQEAKLMQRASIPRMAQAVPASILTQEKQQQQQQQLPKQVQTQAQQPAPIIQQQLQQPNLTTDVKSQGCLYDKRYFAGFDECLSRRPYPIIGLPAFKNEDLLLKNGPNKYKNDGGKRGCLFTLSNGLFKNYQVSAYALDSDTHCLDSPGKVSMSMEFSNATLYYLWQLRCLNHADQLLDDSSLDGKLAESLAVDLENNNKTPRLCAGSSQTFGFTSLQLSNIEAQLELATDIYKNWRVTNVTLAFANGSPNTSARSFGGQQESSSSIKEFTFDSLDGDELNWRYLQMFSNWSRNRLHTNFLEQFRRFVWISLQRCLSESSEKLPVKLFDIFENHSYS